MRLEAPHNTPPPPHCFCSLPTLLKRECQGAVYKCQANLINPPQPPLDNSQPVNEKDSNGRILAGGHFAFASTQPGSPHRLADMRKESKPPDRPPATKAAIQDITSILTSFGKTLGPRSPSLSKHGPKDSTNVSNNSDIKSNTHHNINAQPQLHQIHQQSQHAIPVPPPPPSKLRPVGPIGVCGFHVHASTWESFQVQLCHAESATGGGAGGASSFNRAQGLKRDQAFAEGHHQLILRHSYLHGGFIRQARKDGCKAQMTTVAQWTAWEQGIVDRDPPRAGGVTVPNCFCGNPMRLSYLYNGQGPQMNYVCALRFQDVQHGCSRVLSSAKWAVRKKSVPIQFMSLEVRLPSAKIQHRRDESGLKTLNDTGLTVAHRIEKDDSGSQEALPAAPLASSLDYKAANNDTSRDSRQDSGIEVDENEAEGEYDDEGSEPDWSRSTEWCLNAFSQRKMRLLPIPICLLEMNDWNGDRQGRRRSMPQEEARKNLYDQWGDRRDHSQHEQRKTYDDGAETERSIRSAPTWSVVGVRSLSVAQMRDLYLPLEKPREYSPLIQRLRGSKMLAAERERSEKMLERSETRLRDWEESIERLGAYVKELRQDGLDNNTLLCRSCGKGTFLHANVPCYHLVMCDDCIKKYQRCVVCSSKIESSQRIYW